jgi:hypothetical protein
MLYNILHAGWMADILPKLKRVTTKNGKVTSIDDIYNRAADVATEPAKYDKQEQKTQGESSHPGGKMHNFAPSTSETKDVPQNPSKPNTPDK